MPHGIASVRHFLSGIPRADDSPGNARVRYYQRKALLQPARLPNGVIVARPLGEAVEGHLAEVRSVFAPRK